MGDALGGYIVTGSSQGINSLKESVGISNLHLLLAKKFACSFWVGGSHQLACLLASLIACLLVTTIPFLFGQKEEASRQLKKLFLLQASLFSSSLGKAVQIDQNNLLLPYLPQPRQLP